MSTSGETDLGGRSEGWSDRNGDRDDDREVKVYERTEARRSPATSEFWIYIVITAALLFFTYLDTGDSLSREDGWRYAAAITIAYLLSRGLAKAGSSEPVVRKHSL
jgi:hypothetical protein